MWRRVVAILQGEMALVVVLTKSLAVTDNELKIDCSVGPNDNEATENSDKYTAPSSSSSSNYSSGLDAFFVNVRQTMCKHIEAGLTARIERLNAVHWAEVTQGTDSKIFRATRYRTNYS